MEIVTDIDKLSFRCDEVDVKKDNAEVKEIVLALKNTMREKKMNSLAANQIGYDKRVFVIDFKGDLRTFVNPVVQEIKDMTIAREQCSSIPGKTFIIPRFNKIRVMYQTPLGKIESVQLVGLAATKFQHLLDHLEGVLVSDVGMEIDETFDNTSEEEKQKIVMKYLDSLDIKSKEIEKEIEEDKDLMQQRKAIEFIDKINKGEIQFEGTETRTRSNEQKGNSKDTERNKR